MSYSIEEIKDKLREKLEPQHYEHSLRTAEAARDMARAFGVDVEKAYLAGLLHDYAKSMSNEQLFEVSKQCGIELGPIDTVVPHLLHAKIGAFLVELELGINDVEIIESIRKHTTGSSVMSKLDKIIYVADMIEPGRSFEGLDPLRKMALDDLDEVFRAAYVRSLEYLVKMRRPIHPTTVEVWNNVVLS